MNKSLILMPVDFEAQFIKVPVSNYYEKCD